jgi:hypothetical protein
VSDLQTENLRGAISLGADAIKSLILVNGGAVLALLTFYGNVIARSPIPVALDKSWLAPALCNFASGVAWAIGASICAYLSQLITATMPERRNAEMGVRTTAVLAGLISTGLFVYGVYQAARSFG